MVPYTSISFIENEFSSSSSSSRTSSILSKKYLVRVLIDETTSYHVETIVSSDSNCLSGFINSIKMREVDYKMKKKIEIKKKRVFVGIGTEYSLGRLYVISIFEGSKCFVFQVVNENLPKILIEFLQQDHVDENLELNFLVHASHGVVKSLRNTCGVDMKGFEELVSRKSLVEEKIGVLLGDYEKKKKKSSSSEKWHSEVLSETQIKYLVEKLISIMILKR